MPRSSERRRDDASLYLPYRRAVEYRRGQVIFESNQPADRIYVIAEGRVKLCVGMAPAPRCVVAIRSAGEIFGESALMRPDAWGHSAIAVEPTRLMSWTSDEVEAIVEGHRDARKVFLRMLVQHCLDLKEHVEVMALRKSPERAIWALLRFAERAGRVADKGWVRIAPLTQQVLAEYIGASREMVSTTLSALRRMGLVRYTQRNIDVHWAELQQLYRERLGQDVRHSAVVS